MYYILGGAWSLALMHRRILYLYCSYVVHERRRRFLKINSMRARSCAAPTTEPNLSASGGPGRHRRHRHPERRGSRRSCWRLTTPLAWSMTSARNLRAAAGPARAADKRRGQNVIRKTCSDDWQQKFYKKHGAAINPPCCLFLVKPTLSISEQETIQRAKI